ncbi:MAG: phosphatidylglycerophosphatase A [Methanobrevibacter sp.]|jgi:alpha-ribazole phosphatase CobZ|nr:phosphatidylglycerophosphatase A [Candidatus Methanovirga basalitermitum]
MEDSTTIFNDIKLFKNQDEFVISSENSLSVLGDLNNSKGYDTINKILINNVGKVEEYSISHNFQYNRYYTQNSDNLIIINFANSYLKTNTFNGLKLIMNKKDSKLDLGQIIIINNKLTHKELLELYKIGIKNKEKYFNYRKLPSTIQNFLNSNEFLAIASKTSSNNSNKDFEYIKEEFINSMSKSYSNFFKELDVDFGILDYIYSLGFNIDDLVDAGMELLVGVENTDEIRDKLKNQLLSSISDINVIALIIAAIRTEEDFMGKTLREVNVDDDPAYLYTDEVLGLAIANQIAGTKATFNFKRYDENKPGILSKLDPMTDDIFAGLIAGSMSKIFDEH